MAEPERFSKPSWVTAAEQELMKLSREYVDNPTNENLIAYTAQVQRVAVYLMTVGLPISHLVPFMTAIEARASLNSRRAP